MENIQMTKIQFIKIKNIYKIKNKGSKTRIVFPTNGAGTPRWPCTKELNWVPILSHS